MGLLNSRNIRRRCENFIGIETIITVDQFFKTYFITNCLYSIYYMHKKSKKYL